MNIGQNDLEWTSIDYDVWGNESGRRTYYSESAELPRITGLDASKRRRYDLRGLDALRESTVGGYYVGADGQRTFIYGHDAKGNVHVIVNDLKRHQTSTEVYSEAGRLSERTMGRERTVFDEHKL